MSVPPTTASILPSMRNHAELAFDEHKKPDLGDSPSRVTFIKRQRTPLKVIVKVEPFVQLQRSRSLPITRAPMDITLPPWCFTSDDADLLRYGGSVLREDNNRQALVNYQLR